jgi:hypothetical protein
MRDALLELLADLPGALRDAALIAVFVAGVCALAFVTASVRLTEPPEPARATLITQRGF